MPRYENPAIGASFSLPDEPDFEQLTQYEAIYEQARAGRDGIPTFEYCGAVVQSAAEAGLIGEWNVKARPGVPLSNRARQTVRSVIWAARCIEIYIKGVRLIDPKSLAPVSPTPAES
jgi:hypothetical protein